MVDFGNDWNALIGPEFEKPYYKELRDFLKSEYASAVIYPDMHDIFNALKSTAYNHVKVVILGQDPYHGPNQAHGMCFSVKEGVRKPPSLVNILKELKSDLGIEIPQSGHLQKWADQGVLLLNSVLTVRAGEANSHKGKGWESFTDRVIALLNERSQPIVFLLWGANAREKKRFITEKRHCILEAAHPSPLSAHNGFLGCRHFSKANEFLIKSGAAPLDWTL
ncbi:MAG: uracil-DNA glycosylase [Clostridia bacterium]|nr:uracil-DNA glycosylase [Clostridia bacterium]